MAKGKHSEKNKSKKVIDFKTILISFLVILLIGLSTYFAYFVYNSYDITSSLTEPKEFNKKVLVQGAEYLEVDKLTITPSSDTQYIVTFEFKNTSSDPHSNIPIRISLLDNENNLMSVFDCTISNIEPGGLAYTNASVSQDISNCTNYSISTRE